MIRDFEISDYEIVVGWWGLRSWQPIPLSHLPTVGLVSCIEDKPVAAGWIYQTDSAFCIFEWIISNPLANTKDRSDALDELIKSGQARAKDLGFKTIFMSVMNESLIKRLTSSSFVIGDTHMTNLVCTL